MNDFSAAVFVAPGVSQPKMSRHLAFRCDAGIVRDRRQGPWVRYRVSDSPPAWAEETPTATTPALAA